MEDPLLLPQKTPETGRSFGLPIVPTDIKPAGPSDYESMLETTNRRKATTAGQVAGAIFRQDGLINGFVAEMAGRNLEMDPTYNWYTDPSNAELSKGIAPEFIPYLAQSHSAAHAMYQRDRILEKQADMQRLGDLGVPGTIGRLALNVIMPDQLLMGMASGGLTRFAQARQLSKLARVAPTASSLERGAAAAGAVATAGRSQGSAGAVGLGIGFGAVENVAYEALRQSVNFESDDGALLEASLMGAAFTAPFALAGARQARRTAQAAQDELEALQAIRAASSGETVTPAQAALIEQTHSRSLLVMRAEAGEMSPAELQKALDDGLMGPVEPPEVWMARTPGRVNATARDIAGAFYPDAVPPQRPAPKRAPVDNPMPASWAEIDAANRANPPSSKLADAFPSLKQMRDDLASRGEAEDLDKAWALIDGEVAAQRKAAFEKSEADDIAARERDYVAAERERELQRMVLGGDGPPMPTTPPSPLASPMPTKPPSPEEAPGPLVQMMQERQGAAQELIGFHGTPAKFDRFEVKNEGELGDGFYFSFDEGSARKWGQRKTLMSPEGKLIDVENRAPVNVMQARLSLKNPASAEDVKAAKKALGKDWTPQALTAHLKERGFDGVVSREDNEIVVFDSAQINTSKAPEAAATTQAPESFIGQEVSWRNKDGDTVYGTVERVNSIGKLLIRDDEGEMRSVSHTDLFEFRPSEAPAGFLPGSIGAAQVLPIGSLDQFSSRFSDAGVTLPGTNGKIRVPLRFDLYSYLNSSKVEAVRALANKLVKDPVGRKDFSAQDMTATEWKSHYRRLIGGTFHREFREQVRAAADAAQVPFWKRGAFATDFSGLSSRLLRGDQTALDELDPRAHAALNAATAAQRKALDQMLDEAQKAGVLGAQGVAKNDAYVNRVWRHDKILSAIDKHGEKQVYQLLADALTGMTAKGPLTGDVAKAKSFLGVVMRLNNGPAMQSVHLAGRDMGTLRSELKAMGMDDADINHVVDVMFDARAASGGDAGQAPNLKFRFDLDETLVRDLPNGRLRIADLLENDAQVLMDRYIDSIGGHTGLAKVGYESQAKYAAAVEQARAEVARDPLLNDDRFAAEVAWLEDIQKNLLGRPMSMSSYTGTARLASAFRGYSRSVMLGQLGLTAAFEMKQAIAIMGMRSFITQMPSFSGFLTAIRRGYIPDAGLSRDIMLMTGWGNEMQAAHVRARELAEGIPADLIGRAEHGANVVSHMADLVSGNASFTSITRHLSAKMATQRLFDQAAGLKTMSEAAKRRLAVQGLEGADLDDTAKALVKYADAQDTRVTGIRHEDWAREDPDTYNKFVLYTSRQVRDAIQDQDLGEMPVFAHSVLGKMFTELKTFFLVAHAKNSLKNLHHGDMTTVAVILYGMLGEALAYSLQQVVNQPKDLNERLEPESIGRAVFFRMAALGLLPMLTDTGYSIATGGDSLVKPGTTTNTDNRNFLKTPSFVVAGRLMTLPATAAGAVLGTDVTTRKEAKDALTGLPLSNTYGARWWVEFLASGQPASDPEKTGR